MESKQKECEKVFISLKDQLKKPSYLASKISLLYLLFRCQVAILKTVSVFLTFLFILQNTRDKKKICHYNNVGGKTGHFSFNICLKSQFIMFIGGIPD